MYIQKDKSRKPIQRTEVDLTSEFSPYPIKMSGIVTSPYYALDAAGIPYHVELAIYHATTIVHYALAHWNQYLATNNEHHREVFLIQAYWLVEHEVPIGEDAGGWPISFPHPDVPTTGSWLSALTQGNGISVLVRAYQLTHEKVFLEVAHRVVRTFEHDILDGGISTPIGEDGIFFEEFSVYPATHALSGFIFAILGLYDYRNVTHDAHVELLIQRGLVTMHILLDEFDVGFWTCSDLLHRQLASPSHLTLQIELLEALAAYSFCEHCLRLALCWKNYQQQLGFRLRYFVSSRLASFRHALWKQMHSVLFPKPLQTQTSQRLRVCISLPSFPVTGGILRVLEGISQVTKDLWQREYLTQYVGSQHPENFVIHRFGTAKTTPWLFPLLWLYFLAGWHKLVSLLRHGSGYSIILPQDAIFTGAFSALAAKLAGVRVVCIDHGDLTLLHDKAYQAERMKDLTRKNWHWMFRALIQQLLVFYWPSRYLQARISARYIDHYLVPGIMGDGVEQVCKELGIHASRITRYGSMIDVNLHIVPDAETRAYMRAQKGIAANAIVIAIICRLAPEKNLDIAMESISQALSAISPEKHAHVRVIIAGDGPLRKQLEDDICTRELNQVCTLWGDISAEEVIALLGISDIFLYTSLRGACFAMSVLEAMASGCAVISSTRPISHARLLAEGRGIAVSPGSVKETSQALVRLMNDLELCHQMGELARNYIATHHSPSIFRRILLRATYWSALDEVLSSRTKTEVFAAGKSES